MAAKAPAILLCSYSHCSAEAEKPHTGKRSPAEARSHTHACKEPDSDGYRGGDRRQTDRQHYGPHVRGERPPGPWSWARLPVETSLPLKSRSPQALSHLSSRGRGDPTRQMNGLCGVPWTDRWPCWPAVGLEGGPCASSWCPSQSGGGSSLSWLRPSRQLGEVESGGSAGPRTPGGAPGACKSAGHVHGQEGFHVSTARMPLQAARLHSLSPGHEDISQGRGAGGDTATSSR